MPWNPSVGPATFTTFIFYVGLGRIDRKKGLVSDEVGHSLPSLVYTTTVFASFLEHLLML